MEMVYKTLTFNGIFVDDIMLGKGIYEVQIPRLLSSDTTIEQMIDKSNRLVDLTGSLMFGKEYVANLKKCKLVTLKLIVNV